MPVEAGLDWLEVAWLGLLRALEVGGGVEGEDADLGVGE